MESPDTFAIFTCLAGNCNDTFASEKDQFEHFLDYHTEEGLSFNNKVRAPRSIDPRDLIDAQKDEEEGDVEQHIPNPRMEAGVSEQPTSAARNPPGTGTSEGAKRRAKQKEKKEILAKFQKLFDESEYIKALELVSKFPLSLCTGVTFAKFQSVPVQAGPEVQPLEQYCQILLNSGARIDDFQAVELSRFAISHSKISLIESLLNKDNVKFTEQLGDLLKTVDNKLALECYIKARVNQKVVAVYAEQGDQDQIMSYSKRVGYTPDFLALLGIYLESGAQGAVEFSLKIAQMKGRSHAYDSIIDCFLQRNFIEEATAFLSNVLELRLPEHPRLLAKVFDCMKVMLGDGKHQIIVQTAKKYSELLGMESCVQLFEESECFEGLYLFLEPSVSSSKDPEIHYKYIVATAKTGRIDDLERVTRVSDVYDPEKATNFLTDAKLEDVRPLLNTCHRLGCMKELSDHLYRDGKMVEYIKAYIGKVKHGPLNASGRRATGEAGERVAFDYFVKNLRDKRVTWVNEKEETWKPYDIIIQSIDGQINYIEVKTTVLEREKDWFYISQPQLNFAGLHGKSYTIARVVLSDGSPTVNCFEDVEDLLRKEKLKLALHVE